MQVFAGSFRGKVLFENPEYINPNAVRAYEKRKAASGYDQKKQQVQRRAEHKTKNRVEESTLSDRRVFSLPTGDPSNGNTVNPKRAGGKGVAAMDDTAFEPFSDSHEEEEDGGNSAALHEQDSSEDG
jgi:hypothetical protein